jgi:hypothetical protein
MAKMPPPLVLTGDLTGCKRMLLFCVARRLRWPRADVTGETVSTMVVKCAA